MFRSRRLVKSVLALIALGALALALGGCALIKPGSIAVTQPAGIGTVRVHFNLCTIGGEFCGPNEEEDTVQYLIGIAVPPGSVPPASFTATPIGAGVPIVFSRNEEVTSEMSASSVTLQKALEEAETPEEKKIAEEFKKLIGGGIWPPSGLQGVGYLSTPSQDVEGEAVEWSVDADFGLPTPAGGAPFPGPFSTAIAEGFREVTGEQSAGRPVHCVRFETLTSIQEGEAVCLGGLPQVQGGTSDLKIAAPAKPATAFVGGSAQVGFPLKFAGSGTTVPTFALSATTTAKGGKAKPAASTFTPGPSDPSTHLAPAATGKVTVSLPRGIKPGTYEVTLTATTPQAASTAQVAKFKVTKPKLKLGAVALDPAKGTATLKVKVPSGGSLTIAGKGVATVKKKTKKAKTLKVRIASTGAAAGQLGRAGSAKVKVKATFKPTSGISVSKTKSIVLKLH